MISPAAPTPVFETHPPQTEADSLTSTSGDTDSRFALRFAQDGPQPIPDAVAPAPTADTDLARILDAWPELSVPIRRAILTLVDSAARPA
jgi:hypothetical protein